MRHTTQRMRRGPVLALAAATVLLAPTVSAPALAGGVAGVEQTSKRLGVRLARPVSELQPGRAYEVIVEDPQKLARHGIEDVEQGQRLQVTLSEAESARSTGNNPFLGKDADGDSGSSGKRQTGNNPFLKVELPDGATTRLDIRSDTDLGGPFDRASPESQGGRGTRGDYPAPDNFDDSPDGTTSRGDGSSATPDRRGPIRGERSGNGGQGSLGQRSDGASRDANGLEGHFEGRGAESERGDVPDGTESGKRGVTAPGAGGSPHKKEKEFVQGIRGSLTPGDAGGDPQAGNGGQGSLSPGARGDVPDGTELANPVPTDSQKGGGARSGLRDNGGPRLTPGSGEGGDSSASGKNAVQGIRGSLSGPDGAGGGARNASPGTGSGEAADKASPKIQPDDRLPAVQNAPQLQGQGPGGPGR